jgi:hypothetical protein
MKIITRGLCQECWSLGHDTNWEASDYETCILNTLTVILLFCRYFSQGTIEERDYVAEVRRVFNI